MTNKRKRWLGCLFDLEGDTSLCHLIFYSVWVHTSCRQAQMNTHVNKWTSSFTKFTISLHLSHKHTPVRINDLIWADHTELHVSIIIHTSDIFQSVNSISLKFKVTFIVVNQTLKVQNLSQAGLWVRSASSLENILWTNGSAEHLQKGKTHSFLVHKSLCELCLFSDVHLKAPSELWYEDVLTSLRLFCPLCAAEVSGWRGK